MQSQVIVPLDGSANAEAILPHALLFALKSPSVLTLLRVIIPPGDPEDTVPCVHEDWYNGQVRWTKNYLTSLATRLQAQGADMHTQYLDGTSAGGAISNYAEHHPDVQLIALATHGRSAGGRLLLGSVAKEIYASAPARTSLLLLHPPKEKPNSSRPITRASYQTIVVPFAGTTLSKRVLEQATTLALACHASILLVAVPSLPLLEEDILIDEIEEPLQGVPPYTAIKQADFLAEQAEHLGSCTGLTVQTAVAEGNPAAFIEQYTGHHQQHLLIVTTRQQAKRRAMKFLHQSNVPVLFLAI
jgi:nucleotide-binding universal stress UspA family protein